MAGNCIHGFPEGRCLICQTLGSGTASSTKTAGARTPGNSPVPSPPDRSRRQRAGSGAPVSPDRVYQPGERRGGGSLAGKALGVGVILIVLAVAGWLVAGFVFGVLHIIEIVVLAAAAGWAGFHVGRFQGRREGRSGH